MDKIVGTLGLLYIGSLLAALTGWVLNIIHFVQHLPVFDINEIVRLIGIIVPVIGALLGYFL